MNRSFKIFQVAHAKLVPTMESEVMKGHVLFPLGVTFFTGIFCFHIVKPLMPILALLPTLFNYEKKLDCVLRLPQHQVL